MENKLCLITGASSGIGKASAARLVEAGFDVVMVSRDMARGEVAMNEILSKRAVPSAELMNSDLSSLASVRSLAADFASRHSRLDVLINNAGVFASSRQVTPEGYERIFATNYLGPFLLTRLLLPQLEAGKPSRIIYVTAPSTTRPNLDDLQGVKRFSAMGAFGASKAADLIVTYALARRLEGHGVSVSAYHPGIVRTNLNKTAPVPVRLIAGVLNLIAGVTPERASEGIVQLASSNDFLGTNGKLIHNGKSISAPFSEDLDLQNRLWTASCQMVGLSETI